MASPGSERVVANTSAKWEKVESNDFDFSLKGIPRSDCIFLIYDTFLKIKLITKAVFENPKDNQNTHFSKYEL